MLGAFIPPLAAASAAAGAARWVVVVAAFPCSAAGSFPTGSVGKICPLVSRLAAKSPKRIDEQGVVTEQHQLADSEGHGRAADSSQSFVNLRGCSLVATLSLNCRPQRPI